MKLKYNNRPGYYPVDKIHYSIYRKQREKLRLKCGWNIPVEFLAKSLWYSDCSDRYWFCEADKQIRYSQVN